MAQLLVLAADNAGNNLTMIRHLKTLLLTWGGRTMYVRCFGHILNLSCKVCSSETGSGARVSLATECHAQTVLRCDANNPTGSSLAVHVHQEKGGHHRCP